MMKRVTKGTLGFAVAACGLLIFFQNAMAATIQVMSPEDDQIVNQSDNFQITITGEGFTDGSLGGGLDLTWDPALVSFVSADTSAFPGDQIVGNLGTLDSAAGLLQDLSVSSLFTAAPGPDFTIAVVTFSLLVGNTPTNIDIALGTFPSGAGDDVWTNASSEEIIIDSYSGAQINAVIPVPAAVWLFGSALGLLGWVRRRAA
jgi:hypothetical protein